MSAFYSMRERQRGYWMFQANNVFRTAMRKMLTACSMSSKVRRHSAVTLTIDVHSHPSCETNERQLPGQCTDNTQLRQLLKVGDTLRLLDERHVSYEECCHGLTLPPQDYVPCNKTTLRTSGLTTEDDGYDRASSADGQANSSGEHEKRNVTGKRSFIRENCKIHASRCHERDNKIPEYLDDGLRTAKDFVNDRQASYMEGTSSYLKWKRVETEGCKSDVLTLKDMTSRENNVRDHSRQEVIYRQSLTSLQPTTNKVNNIR